MSAKRLHVTSAEAHGICTCVILFVRTATEFYVLRLPFCVSTEVCEMGLSEKFCPLSSFDLLVYWLHPIVWGGGRTLATISIKLNCTCRCLLWVAGRYNLQLVFARR